MKNEEIKVFVNRRSEMQSIKKKRSHFSEIDSFKSANNLARMVTTFADMK